MSERNSKIEGAHHQFDTTIETAERLICCIASAPLDLGWSNIAISAPLSYDDHDQRYGRQRHRRAARKIALTRGVRGSWAGLKTGTVRTTQKVFDGKPIILG